jgi:hypothetical protein
MHGRRRNVQGVRSGLFFARRARVRSQGLKSLATIVRPPGENSALPSCGRGNGSIAGRRYGGVSRARAETFAVNDFGRSHWPTGRNGFGPAACTGQRPLTGTAPACRTPSPGLPLSNTQSEAFGSLRFLTPLDWEGHKWVRRLGYSRSSTRPRATTRPPSRTVTATPGTRGE